MVQWVSGRVHTCSQPTVIVGEYTDADPWEHRQMTTFTSWRLLWTPEVSLPQKVLFEPNVLIIPIRNHRIQGGRITHEWIAHSHPQVIVLITFK